MTIRHYCQGIGDCHLLRFAKDDGSPFFMLIDCGVHSSVSRGAETMRRVVADIASVTGRIDVLVVTHEHWDHVSGFLSAAEGFAGIEVGEVWMGWTENPADPQARQLDKFKADALAALQGAGHRLDRARDLGPHLAGLRDGLRAVLGFNFGAQGERVRAARDAAAALAQDGRRYLEPGGPPLSLVGVGGIRIYVLGPPRDAALLGVTERASEMYGLAGAGGWSMAAALGGALGLGAGLTESAEDCAAPFDPNLGSPLSALLDPGGAHADSPKDRSIRAFVQDHYAGAVQEKKASSGRRGRREPDPAPTDQAWRRIDMDWLGVSADLALQLDDRTNNTSLALAFEIVGSRRVLLFVADAQVGNWLSWQDLRWGTGDEAVTGPDLLARTVYYKVGHHGSHNATLKAKGLGLMSSSDLAAFVPTNAADAKKVGWGEMPFKGILDELERRAGGRVIRADDPWIQTETVDERFQAPTGSIRSVRHGPGLWVELEIA